VSIFSLFFPDIDILPPAEVQKTLWQRLDVVDAFSIGSTPYRLASALGKAVSPWSGVREALPLLLTAVADDRRRLRFHDNPVQIFSILDLATTNVEVMIGRKAPFSAHPSCWPQYSKRLVQSIELWFTDKRLSWMVLYSLPTVDVIYLGLTSIILLLLSLSSFHLRKNRASLRTLVVSSPSPVRVPLII